MTLDEFDRELARALVEFQRTIDAAATVRPQGHRLAMARSQLEAARDSVVRAQQFARASASGLYSITHPPKIEEPR